MVSFTEENYLKAIYKIAEKDKKPAGTNAIAGEMETSAASVTDMLKRLAEKGLINYQKYKGVSLSPKGSRLATNLIRKHRLWESFLVTKLGFTWDKVHDIAEQMEHIKSDELVQRLDEFLDCPKFDPHGDPIPNAEGKFTLRVQILLSLLRKEDSAKVIGVKEHDDEFLRYLNSKSIQLGTTLHILEKNDYDKSMTVEIEGKEVVLTRKSYQTNFCKENGMKKIILAICFLLPLILFSQKKTIVASASMMADMAENIAGDLLNVKYIVPRGQDPHLYKPTPSDVIMVQNADLIIINGLTFEGWIAKLIDNSGTKATTYTITEGINAIQSSKYQNSFDPHAWMDVSLVQTYIDNIKNALIELLPEHAGIFEKNHATYSAKLKELDDLIMAEIKRIPESQRILITSHDAFAYYGRRYGLQLEAIVGISTEAEVQSSDIIRVHKVIKESKVPSIFMESTINPKILQQIAKDNKIVIGGELYADSLGEDDSPANTYLKMLKYNTETIVKGLTSAQALDSEKTQDSGGFGLWGFLALGLGLAIIMGIVVRKIKQRIVWQIQSA